MNLPNKAPSRPELERDSYFSINGFRKWGTRRTEDLSALNAAAVDLDYDRIPTPLTWQAVVETIEQAVANDIIPAPSLLVNSGRGAWLVWLLVADDDPSRAPTAPVSNRRFLRMINDRLAAIIAKRLPQLGVDPSSAELTRCLRVPGSINSKSASHVRFFLHRTPWNAPLTYTLDRLATEIDVHEPSFRREQRSFAVAQTPKASGSKRGGERNLSRMLKARLEEIEKLEQARGGFREGHRNNAALVIAVTLRTLRRSPEDLEHYLTEFARSCQPPLAPANIRGAIADRRYRFTNTSIAARLGVTLEEADALGLRVIRPDYRPKRPDANIRKGRNDVAVLRRKTLRTIIEESDDQGHHGLLSLADFVARLETTELRTTKRTVAKDLDALGISRSHRRGVPKRDASQLTLRRT